MKETCIQISITKDRLRVATTFPKCMNRELDLVTYDSQKALNDSIAEPADSPLRPRKSWSLTGSQTKTCIQISITKDKLHKPPSPVKLRLALALSPAQAIDRDRQVNL